MILTCPSCATQYSVDDARMDRPRQVRCAACKTAWTASPAGEPEELPVGAQLLGDDTPLYRPEPAPSLAAEAEPPSVEKAGNPVAKLFRQKTQAKQETRKAVAAGVVWGGLAAGMALVLGAAVLFRVEVVRLIPATAGAYAHAGLPVNPVGLAPEGVEAGPGLHNGHAAVIVTGRLRNIQTKAHPPAPLRIILMDKGGRRLTDQVLPAGDHPLQPGEARPFQLAFLDPPSGVSQVQVEFAFDAMKAEAKPRAEKTADHGHETPKPAAQGGSEAPQPSHHAAPAHPPLSQAAPHGEAHNQMPLGLRGAAAPSPVAPIPAKVAQPLPKDSPYALPAPARTHGEHG